MPKWRNLGLLLLIAAVSVPAAAGLLVPAPGDLLAELLARDEALVRQTRIGVLLLLLLAAIAAAAVGRVVVLQRRLAAARQEHEDDLDALGSLSRELAGGGDRMALPAAMLRQLLVVVPGVERASLLEREPGGVDYHVSWSVGERVAVGRVVADDELSAQLGQTAVDLGARVVLLPGSLLDDGAGRSLAVEVGSGPGRRFLVLDGLTEGAAAGVTAGRLQTLGELVAAAAAAARQAQQLIGQSAKTAAARVVVESTRAELERVTRADALTGLPNRREVLERLTAEWRRSSRYGGNGTLLLADLDNFRELNDEHGPACGDFVLVETARLLRRVLRDQDTAARWSGEEFLVLLPETEHEGGALVAERIRTAMAGADLMWQGELLGVTLSLGVVELSTMRTPAETIGLANEALQLAKRRGRNRVEVAVGRQARRAPENPVDDEPAPASPATGAGEGAGGS